MCREIDARRHRCQGLGSAYELRVRQPFFWNHDQHPVMLSLWGAKHVLLAQNSNHLPQRANEPTVGLKNAPLSLPQPAPSILVRRLGDGDQNEDGESMIAPREVGLLLAWVQESRQSDKSGALREIIPQSAPLQ